MSGRIVLCEMSIRWWNDEVEPCPSQAVEHFLFGNGRTMRVCVNCRNRLLDFPAVTEAGVPVPHAAFHQLAEGCLVSPPRWADRGCR